MGFLDLKSEHEKLLFVKRVGAQMKQLIASTLCLAFLLPAVHAESDTSQRPDIVFIIVDDLNDWIGCLGGHPDAKSPNIDALAEGGMLFSQAYCNAPQCR